VLVAGSGSIAARHMRNLLAMGVGRVVVLSARDLRSVSPFDDARVVPTVTIPEDCPGVAIVANDTALHVKTTRRLLEAGAHVLVEKPLAAGTSEELRDLVREVAATDRVVRVAYNLRFLGAIQRIAALLREGRIGTPLFARIEAGQWLPDWRPGRDYRDGYSASASRGGGVALDLSHEIDYMRMLLGMPTAWSTYRAVTGLLDGDSEDVFEGVYSFDDGALCSVHLDYLERQPRRRIRIVGSAGTIECDIPGQRLDVSTGGTVTALGEPDLFDVERTYIREVEAFLAEIEGTPAGLPTLEDAVDVLRLLRDPNGGGADV
jgi:predicted dehydrogenase